MPRFVRLDPDDATFVDVIHTDAKSILMLGKNVKENFNLDKTIKTLFLNIMLVMTIED